MYYVYKLTINKKVYIGYTGQTIKERFHKHCLNASSGMQSHLYCTMRKYGFENVSVEELQQCNDQEMAHIIERLFIEQYDSVKNGMNMTLGGDGGNSRAKMTLIKLEEYNKKRSIATSGNSNPNHSGYSDEDLINFAINLVLEKGYFSIGDWIKQDPMLNIPKCLSKYRFGGNGFKELKSIVSERLGFDVAYKKTTKHSENLSKSNRKYSNQELLNYGCQLVSEFGYFSNQKWKEYHYQYGTPISFSRRIFKGSMLTFKEEIAKKMGVTLESILIQTYKNKIKNDKN